MAHGDFRRKIKTREELCKAIGPRPRAKSVIMCHGIFDLVHPGHIRLLESARSLGDVLILALNTDASVQRIKGPTRPLIHERDRAELACALAAVDAVTFFESKVRPVLVEHCLGCHGEKKQKGGLRLDSAAGLKS